MSTPWRMSASQRICAPVRGSASARGARSPRSAGSRSRASCSTSCGEDGFLSRVLARCAFRRSVLAVVRVRCRDRRRLLVARDGDCRHAEYGARVRARDELRVAGEPALRELRRRCMPLRASRLAAPPASTSTSSFRAARSIAMMSPSRSSPIGPPSAASGETWPMHRPRVPPEKRPSVISATLSPIGIPLSMRRERQHLAHARSAARSLVAHDDHVAGLDLAGDRGVGRRLLAVEHARRTAEGHLVLRHRADLDHRAESGASDAEEHAERAALGVRVVERADALGVRVLDALRAARRASCRSPSAHRGRGCPASSPARRGWRGCRPRRRRPACATAGRRRTPARSSPGAASARPLH